MGFFSRVLKAASIENPQFNLNDPAAWDTFLEGGRRSSSGESINRNRALTASAFWRGVNLISRDVAKLPYLVYRRIGEGKERSTEHPAYKLLRYKPNESMTAFAWRQTVQAHVLVDGNGYSYIYRNGDGTPREIVLLDPDVTYPVRENGRPWFVTQVDGEERKLPAEDVIHIKGLGYDGLMGYSVLHHARESLGLSIAAEKYGAIFFGNSARPNVVLLHPAKLDDRAKINLRESWERMAQGLNNAHRTAVLDQGLTLKELTINAEDSQLIETRNFQIREIANFLNVPPHKLGDQSKTAYASLEQENQAYLDDGLDPWLVNWEEECRDKLLTEEEKERDTHVVEFLRQALVRADLTARANYYRTGLGGRPWLTQNEVRSRENLNPVDGGDEILEPLNMGQEGGIGGPGPGSDPPEKKESQALAPVHSTPEGGYDPKAVRDVQLYISVLRVLEDVTCRMIRRVGLHAKRAATDPKKYMDWLESFEEEHKAVVTEALTPGLQIATALVGRPFDPVAEADQFLTALAADFSSLADHHTALELPAAVETKVGELEREKPTDAALGWLGTPPPTFFTCGDRTP